jgi:hypothetical protein
LKLLKVFLSSLITLALTACTFSASVESLLSPPTLSEEQRQIYQALTDKVGTKVSLKYPKSGSYLSAFVIADIDDEPTDEAIVFYERNGITADEISLRINILDKRDDKWSSVYDSPANGTEVEKVIISKLGSSELTNIIVGYNMSQGEKNLSVYNYSDGILNQSYSDIYSVTDVCDIDSDGLSELIVITGNSVSETAEAKLLKLDENGQYLKYRTPMNESSIDYSQYLYSGNSDGTRTIMVDSVIGTNTIQTEILSPSENDALIYSLNSESLLETVRPSSYISCDIDNDGIVEIPSANVFPGYGELSETEQITMTDWLAYEEGVLYRKYSGYYNINDGYAFMMPERWYGNVTVKIDSFSNEVVFYRYSSSIDESTSELMRISVINSADDSGKIRDGYKLIHSKGDMEYFVIVPEDSSDELIPSVSEILCGFKFI